MKTSRFYHSVFVLFNAFLCFVVASSNPPFEGGVLHTFTFTSLHCSLFYHFTAFYYFDLFVLLFVFLVFYYPGSPVFCTVLQQISKMSIRMSAKFRKCFPRPYPHQLGELYLFQIPTDYPVLNPTRLVDNISTAIGEGLLSISVCAGKQLKSTSRLGE